MLAVVVEKACLEPGRDEAEEGEELRARYKTLRPESPFVANLCVWVRVEVVVDRGAAAEGEDSGVEDLE